MESAPDREDSMSDGLMRLVQSRMMDALVETEQIDDQTLARFARAVAELGRASVQQKRWMEDVRERLEHEKRAADRQISEIGSAAGLSPEAAQAIRAALMGIDIARSA
jgi:hypothetical protein